MGVNSPNARSAFYFQDGRIAAGFTSAMHAGLEVLAPLYVPKTGVGVQFTEIRQRRACVPHLRGGATNQIIRGLKDLRKTPNWTLSETLLGVTFRQIIM